MIIIFFNLARKWVLSIYETSMNTTIGWLSCVPNNFDENENSIVYRNNRCMKKIFFLIKLNDHIQKIVFIRKSGIFFTFLPNVSMAQI